MKRLLLYGLLLLPPFFAQAMREMPRTKLADTQRKFNQLIEQNAQKHEAQLCSILQQISDNPIARKPEVTQWLSVAHERLDVALGRPSLCSRVPAPMSAAIPAPLYPPAPAALPRPSAPEIKPLPAPSAPTPSAPAIKPETIPSAPAPSAREIKEPQLMPIAPAPSAPEIKKPGVVIPQEKIPQAIGVEIPAIFDQINTIITRNKFQPRQAWPAQDQEQLDDLIARTAYDKNFSDLLRAYLQEYPTVQKPAQFVLQTAQAVNFLYAKPLNNTEVQKAIKLLEKKGGHHTAKILKEWPGVILPLAEEQREEKVQKIKDILDRNKILVAEPYEVWLDKIKKEESPEKKKELEELNNIRESFILEAGHEKEPDSYKAMLRRIEELHFMYAQQEAEQLKKEIENQLYVDQDILNQEAINRIFDYLIDANDRTAGYTLIRILKDAVYGKEAAQELETLITLCKEHGSSKAFMKLKEFVKPDDERQAKLKWPARVDFNIDTQLKLIRGYL